MKNAIYHFSLNRIILFTYLIFTVLPSKATILKFNCVGNFGYDVSYKINFKNHNIKKSRPIFAENKTSKNFIVSYNLETGNGSIDGNRYSDELTDITAGNSLLFKSKKLQSNYSNEGSISKSDSNLEIFYFIIDDFENLNKYKVSNIKGSSYFSAQKRRVLENKKSSILDDYYESEIKTNYEFISGLCK
tara:strand:+ start:1469 stop:2035 length:567 start_codon:yes stop_codon:yes gene_type:complete